MRKITGKLLVVLLVGVIVVLAAGCEEESLSQADRNTKKSRLVAMKNKELQNELAECNKEVEKLKATVKNINKGTNMILETIMVENQTLTKENKKLKKKLEQLKKI